MFSKDGKYCSLWSLFSSPVLFTNEKHWNSDEEYKFEQKSALGIIPMVIIKFNYDGISGYFTKLYLGKVGKSLYLDVWHDRIYTWTLFSIYLHTSSLLLITRLEQS